MSVTKYTDDEIEYRIKHAVNTDPYCMCGKPLTPSKCVDCGEYGVESIGILLDFVEGRSKSFNSDLLRSIVQHVAMVPVLDARIVELTKRVDDLETQQQRAPALWKWLSRIWTAINVVEWIRGLVGLVSRGRRTS